MLGLNGVISATQGIFHIAKHGIDPVKCRMLYTLWTTADDMNFVLTTCMGNSIKARQPIANDLAARK